MKWVIQTVWYKCHSQGFNIVPNFIRVDYGKKNWNVTVTIYAKYFTTNHSITYRHLWLMYKPWLTLQPKKSKESFSQYGTYQQHISLKNINVYFFLFFKLMIGIYRFSFQEHHMIQKRLASKIMLEMKNFCFSGCR